MQRDTMEFDVVDGWLHTGTVVHQDVAVLV